MVVVPDITDMLKCGVHFGHKRSRRHPKMDPYIFTTRNDVAVIDLDKTKASLEKALSFVSELVRKGGTLLFIGTKKQASAIIEKCALGCGMPYVANHWIGGTLTNYTVISRMIRKFKKMKEKIESGELATKYTKKEQLDFTREHDELRMLLGGIQDLTKLPEAVFIVDMKAEKTALREAKRKGLPIVAMCDANANPDLADVPIPCNDDAVKSIDMIVNLIASAVVEGKALREQDIAQSAEQKNASVPSENAPGKQRDATSALTL